MAALFVMFIFFVLFFVKLTGSVYQGTYANEGEFSYIVRLHIGSHPSAYGGEDRSVPCTGTIIRDNLILTAAHCFDDKDKGDLDVVAVVTYTYDNYLDDHPDERISCLQRGLDPKIPITQDTLWVCYRARDYRIHPDYRKGYFAYDIALVYLERPMRADDEHKVFPCDEIGFGPASNCATVGFGRDLELKPPEPRLKKYTPGRTFEACMTHEITAEEGKVSTAKYRTLCSKASRVTQYGDSGSPLVCCNKIYGILSHGFGKAGEDDQYVDSYNDCYTSLAEPKVLQFLKRHTHCARQPEDGRYFTYALTCMIDVVQPVPTIPDL